MMIKQEQRQKLKKPNYRKPQLVRYGWVRDLTHSGSLGNPEGGSQKPDKKAGFSDRRVKENIVAIGRHSLGIGLYLFDYKPEFRDTCGQGRQFGVMADEVEVVMPEAVSVSLEGYKMVNYSMLGIERVTH